MTKLTDKDRKKEARECSFLTDRDSGVLWGFFFPVSLLVCVVGWSSIPKQKHSLFLWLLSPLLNYKDNSTGSKEQ